MRLSRAIQKYVAMKQVMGISYNEGGKVLNAFCRHVADVSLRSVAKWQVLEFLERSVLSDVTWFFRYRTLKAFFDHWMARGQLDVLLMPNPRRPGTARVFVPYIYSVSEVREIIRLASLRRDRGNHEKWHREPFISCCCFCIQQVRALARPFR
jgi:hypothetical protein